MHAVWTLPANDTDFSTRWRFIKSGSSRALPKTEYRSVVRIAANERGNWQRHFWEHANEMKPILSGILIMSMLIR